MKKQTPNRLKSSHQKLIGKMVQSFIMQAAYQPQEKVLELYKSFASEWKRRVDKVNDQYGEFILSYDVWDREWKENGYHKFITIPVPKQLPKDQKAELLKMKTELVRLVYIVEEKTEHQRQRRELKYKIIFLSIRFKLWFKSAMDSIRFKNKEVTKECESTPKMRAV